MKTIILFLLSLLSINLLIAQNFEEVASSLNINATYESTILGSGTFGGGVSFADFNQDGWDDLTFASGIGLPLVFFINNQGTYLQVNPGIYNTQETKQVLWVDFDNDGDKDFFCTVVNGFNHLYRNNGDNSFTDISQMAGVMGSPNADSFGACFGDYNNDGWLDLYVANRQFSSGEPTNYLYTNNANGTFTEFGGNLITNNGVKPTFAPVFFDADRNGWQDIFLAQDRLNIPNDLLLNTNGNFTNVSVEAGVNHYIDGMNAGVADYDNDNDLDIYVTNTPDGNLLLRNDGSGVFTNVAAAAGVIANHVGWGGNFFDAENDGDLDLYVSCSINNGSESNRFYTNTGNGTFTENVAGGLPGDLVSSYGNAIGDYNNDGQLDIAVSNSITNHFVWKNNNVFTNNWLKIDLIGTVSNRDGVGSWVEIYAGTDTYLRYKHCGEAYLAQNTDYLHVGLNDHTVIDEIKVFWLSGNVSTITNVNANQRIQIFEENVPLAITVTDFHLSSIEDNAFNLSWTINDRMAAKEIILQKSTTGNDFEDIPMLNSSDRYRDWEVQKNQQYYYRLKVVDAEGNIIYSDIIAASLKIRSSILSVSIFPNPSDKLLNLQINSFAKGQVKYSILDGSGRQLNSFNETVEMGTNDFQFEIESLNPNQYFLQIEINGEIIYRPFTKI